MKQTFKLKIDMNNKSLFLIFSCFLIISCVQNEKSSTIKQKQSNDNSIEIAKKHVDNFEQKLAEKPAQKKIKKTKKRIDYITICNFKIRCIDTLLTKNTIEYHLENGILFIKEFYPNKELKSESYWVDNLTPVYKLRRYDESGKLISTIDKSIGKFDLCELLNRINANSVLKNKVVDISLSGKPNTRKRWYVSYNNENYQTVSSSEGIYYDSQTGNSEQGGEMIFVQPDIESEPTPEQLPTFPEGLETFKQNLILNLDIPNDSIHNSRVIASFSVNSNGIVSNFDTQGSSTFINNANQYLKN